MALYTPIAKQYGAMSIVKWRDTNDDDADDDNVRPPYSLGVILAVRVAMQLATKETTNILLLSNCLNASETSSNKVCLYC